MSIRGDASHHIPNLGSVQVKYHHQIIYNRARYKSYITGL